LTRTKRAVLTVYGVASAFIFVWVPWRGYETPIYQVPKDRWNSTFLGYGLIWSQPRPPAEFVAYYLEDIRYAEDFAKYQRSHPWDCVDPPALTKEEAALGFKPDPPPGQHYCIGDPPLDLRAGYVGNEHVQSKESSPSSQTPPKGYVEVPAPIQSKEPKPVRPRMPQGYISPGIYRWARLDYERVLLEFGALTGLLLVAWMLTYAEGRGK